MNELNQEDVRKCMYMLSEADDPAQAVLAWHSLKRMHPHLSAIISLSNYDKAVMPSWLNKYSAKPNDFMVPYFSTEKIYFLDDQLVYDTFSLGEEFKFPVDYTLMFDTNIATYVGKLVRGEALGNVQSRIVSLIDSILYDGLNFDFLFYMVENVKSVLPQIEQNVTSKIRFWKSLEKGFRRNLVGLQVFSSIDCKEYRRTLNPRPQLTYWQAARQAIDFTYDFYVSELGKGHILDFVRIQKMILLQLIGMVKIQLSSAKGARYKIGEYFKFIQGVIGVYSDREAIIAHKYFNDRNAIAMLEKIKKGCGKMALLKRLDNIAWDMAAPRFMEKLIVAGGEGRYFIPMFLTFDSGLRELLGHYPVKGVVFNKQTGVFAPIPAINTREYFINNGCQDEIDFLCSDSARLERLSRQKLTRLTIHRLIRHEYRALRSLI